MGVKVQLKGRVFGRLTVIKQVEHYEAPSGRLFVMWLCQCSCGNTNIVRTSSLTSKSSKALSCGCLSAEKTKERAKTHGMSNTREYVSYQAMVKRCYNKNDPSYQNYGGRGIRVCSSWLQSFEEFYKDMGDRPENTSIDREDNEGDYCLGNCRWSDKSTQQLNRRNFGISKYRGVSWCSHYKYWCLKVKTGRKYYDMEEEAAEAYDQYIIENSLPNKLNKIEDYPEGWFD